MKQSSAPKRLKTWTDPGPMRVQQQPRVPPSNFRTSSDVLNSILASNAHRNVRHGVKPSHSIPQPTFGRTASVPPRSSVSRSANLRMASGPVGRRVHFANREQLQQVRQEVAESKARFREKLEQLGKTLLHAAFAPSIKTTPALQRQVSWAASNMSFANDDAKTMMELEPNSRPPDVPSSDRSSKDEVPILPVELRSRSRRRGGGGGGGGGGGSGSSSSSGSGSGSSRVNVDVSQKTRTDDQFQPKNTRRNTTGKVQVILQGKKDELLAVAEECFPYMPKGETDPMLSLAVVPVATLLEVRDRCQYTCDGLLVLRDTDDDDAPSFRLAPECSCPFTAGPSVYGKTVLSEAGDVFFNRKPFIGNSANRLAPFFEVDCYGFTPFNLNDNNLGRYQAEFCLGEPTVQTLMGWDLVTEYADPSHHILMVVESPIMKTDYHFYTPNLNFVAGSVEPTKDRNLVDAALREVVEETGIVLSPEECVPLGVPITKTLWRNVPSGDAQSKKCQVFLIHDLGSNRSRQSRSLLIHDADRCLRRQDGRIQSIQSMRRLMSAAFFVPREYGVDVYDAACMALRSQLSYWRGKRPRTSRLLRSHSLREGDLQCVLLIEVVQQMQQVQGSEFHYLHAKYFPCEYAPTLAELRTKLSLPRLSVDDVTRAWYGYDWGDCHYKLKVDVMEQERRRGGGVNTGGKYTKQQHHSNTNRSRTTAKEPPGNGRWGRGQKPSQHRHNRGGGGGGGGGRGGGGGGGSGGGYKGGGGGYRGGGGGYSGGGGGAGGGYR